MQSGKAEINVTPLIDVLLVLLIIFMVITPLVPRGLSTDVPAKSVHDLRGAPLVLEMAADGTLSINKQPVAPNVLSRTIESLYSSRANRVLFLSADKSLQYRNVAELIDQLKGFNTGLQVALVP